MWQPKFDAPKDFFFVSSREAFEAGRSDEPQDDDTILDEDLDPVEPFWNCRDGELFLSFANHNEDLVPDLDLQLSPLVDSSAASAEALLSPTFLAGTSEPFVCTRGEYTSFTGAHVLVVISDIPGFHTHKSMLALADVTRRLDPSRAKNWKMSRVPHAPLEFPNLWVRCVAPGEVEAVFETIPKFAFPEKRRHQAVGENVYWPYEDLESREDFRLFRSARIAAVELKMDLNKLGDSPKNETSAAGSIFAAKDAATFKPDEAPVPVFMMRFSKEFSEPSFLDNRVASLGKAVYEKHGRSYRNIPDSDAWMWLIPERGQNLVFNKFAHSYQLVDVEAALEVSAHPYYLPLVSWSGLSKLLFDGFDANSVRISRQLEGSIDHVGEGRKDVSFRTWYEKRTEEGTALHKIAEIYYNLPGSEEFDTSSEERSSENRLHNLNPEWQLGFLTFAKEFMRDIFGAIPLQTEIRLWYRPLLITGTADMLYERLNPRTGETEFILCDWKRMVLDGKQHERDEVKQNEEWAKVVKEVRGLNAPSFVSGSRERSRLWAKVQLITYLFGPDFQNANGGAGGGATKWEMTRLLKYRLQLLFYKWIAELTFGIRIKYSLIVALSPQEKLTEKIGFLDRAVGVDVTFVDGGNDGLNARLQQILMLRYEMLLSAGYRYDAGLPLNDWGEEFDDAEGPSKMGSNRRLPNIGAVMGDFPSRSNWQLLEAGSSFNETSNSFANSGMDEKTFSDIPLTRSALDWRAVRPNTPGTAATAPTTTTNQIQATEGSGPLLKPDLHTETFSVWVNRKSGLALYDVLDLDHSDGTVIRVKDRLKLESEYLLSSSPVQNNIRVGDRILRLEGERRQSKLYLKEEPLRRRQLFAEKMNENPQGLWGLRLIREPYQVRREEKSTIQKLREEGFSPEKWEKLKMFSMNFEAEMQKAEGVRVGEKVWDRTKNEVGKIVRVEKALHVEPIAELEFAGGRKEIVAQYKLLGMVEEKEVLVCVKLSLNCSII